MVSVLNYADLQRLQSLLALVQTAQLELEAFTYALAAFKRELAERYQIADGEALDLRTGAIERNGHAG